MTYVVIIFNCFSVHHLIALCSSLYPLLMSRKMKKYVNKKVIPACELKLWPVELLDELLVSLLSSITNLLFSVLEERTDDSFPFDTA